MKLTDILREVKGNLLKEYMGQDFYSDPNGNDPFILDMLMKHTLSSYPKHKVNDDPYAGIDEKGNWVLKYEFTLDQTPGIEYFAMLYIPLDILEVLKKRNLQRHHIFCGMPKCVSVKHLRLTSFAKN